MKRKVAVFWNFLSAKITKENVQREIIFWFSALIFATLIIAISPQANISLKTTSFKMFLFCTSFLLSGFIRNRFWLEISYQPSLKNFHTVAIRNALCIVSWTVIISIVVSFSAIYWWNIGIAKRDDWMSILAVIGMFLGFIVWAPKSPLESLVDLIRSMKNMTIEASTDGESVLPTNEH